MYWNLKMITFISDLDHTLIYSKRNINIDKNYATCVEYINDKSITYKRILARAEIFGVADKTAERNLKCAN